MPVWAALMLLVLSSWVAQPALAQSEPEEAAETAPAESEPAGEPADEPAAPPEPGRALPSPAQPPPPPAPTVHRREVVSIFASSHVRANETSREMITVFGHAIVDGHVRGECVTVLGNVTVNGRVDGELVCIGGQVTIGPNAEVRGEIVSVGGRINAAPTAIIHGERVEVPFLGGLRLPSLEWLNEWFSEGLMLGRPLPHTAGWAWAFAGVLFVANLLFYALFRGPIEASASALGRKPAMALVNSLLFLVLVGPLLFLLLISVVGIILVPFVMAGAFLAAFAGFIAVYRFCGGQLGLNRFPVVALIVGQTLFLVLYAVPFVGFAVFTMAGLLGLGCTLTALVESARRERGDRKPPAPVYVNRPVEAHQQPASAPSFSSSAVGRELSGAAGEPSAAAAGFVQGAAVAGEEGSAAAGASMPPPVPPKVQQSRVQQHGPLLIEQLERVGFWPRLGASAIDFLIVAPLSIWVSSLLWWFPGDTPTFPLLWLLYHAAFWSWRATTIGGHVLNLRIVRLDHGKMDVGVGIVRALGAVLSLLPLGFGFIWASWDDERQSWHDKIAGTTIVRGQSGRSLF